MKDKNQDLDTFEIEDDTSSHIQDTLSEEEIKMLEASKSDFDRNTLPSYDNSDFAKAKRFAKKNKFTVLFVAITMILLITVITLLVVMVIKSNEDAPCTDDFSINFLDNKDASYTIPYGEATIDGVFYFDVRSLADYAGLTVSGGTNSLTLWCSDGTYVRFEHESETAIVNGKRVIVGGTVNIVDKKDGADGKCIIPFSFVQKLFSYEVVKGWPGLKIVFNKDLNKVEMKRMTYQGTQTYLPLSFSEECFELADYEQMM